MIGIFDSGVGGLTVVKEIFKQLPGLQIIYFGDTARLPYGTKGADFVKRYSQKITKYLLNRGAKVIVVACNTSSAWAAESLRKEFPNVPIFEMIQPAVKAAVAATKNNRIGIIGTPGTIKSGIYEKTLLKENRKLKVFSKACPLLVPLVEEGLVDGKVTKKIVQDYLLGLKQKNIDVLILGCTHYPFLESLVESVVGKGIKIINPAESLAAELKDRVQHDSMLKQKIKKSTHHEFIFSDEPYNFRKISHLCFNKRLDIQVEDPFE
ncbi:MAG: glutamate racemase [Candidatus Staskawiczbacteria bacterium]|jgi:glutamate racemase